MFLQSSSNRRRAETQGFTLIEVMVALAILAWPDSPTPATRTCRL